MFDRLGHKMKLLFPGGKEEALVREIRENLHSVKWLPADDVILNDIEKLL